ncbi:MAG TPA: DUF2207 domain-containing protein, partial [Longimicrobiales bacterium]|nr:DUF2207 domain-containing protein [Longimicrobiales bacterium]
GIYRTIPIRYRSWGEFGHTLILDLESITDGSGQPLRYETSTEGDSRTYKVWVPDARDATRTVRIRYRADRALKHFEEHDELYWNVTGTEWPVPIDEASVRVVLPEGATGIRARAFTGAFGSTEEAADIRLDGSLVDVRASRPLEFREGLTVAVAWDPGVVDRPGAAANVLFFLRSNWPLFFPVFAFLGMLALWRRIGRDPRRRPIAPAYEPPEGLTPGDIGLLMDHRPDMRDITATMVDLAVRGFVRVKEEERDLLFGLLDRTDYVFEMVAPRERWDELARHERLLLAGLFEHGARPEVAMSDLEEEFYKHLPDIKKALYERALDRKDYRWRPDRVAAVFIGAGLAIGGVLTFLGLALASGGVVAPAAAIAGGVLTALVILGFAVVMPARTIAGTRRLEQILGFEEFLEAVDSDRFRRMVTGPEMFEHFLPFAMALQVEKRWARAFEAIYAEPPQPSWYVGSGNGSFRPTHFTSRVGQMTGRAQSAMASSPRSSGGSGFSGGGGSSGGGMGGGGGGAF